MEFKELKEKVIQWGADKGILDRATPLAQCLKTKEEYEELEEAVKAQSEGEREYINSKGVLVKTEEEIQDAVGDIIVTLILQCALQKIEIEKCLEGAYNVISKRTGKMINGQFVKDK